MNTMQNLKTFLQTQLGLITDEMHGIQRENTINAIQSDNRRRLLLELDKIIDAYSIDDEDIIEEDKEFQELRRIIPVAIKIQEAISESLQRPEIISIRGVRDQLDHIHMLKKKLSKKITTHLISIQRRDSIQDLHNYFQPFIPLLNWLQELDMSNFIKVKSRYCELARPVYVINIKKYFQSLSIQKDEEESNLLKLSIGIKRQNRRKGEPITEVFERSLTEHIFPLANNEAKIGEKLFNSNEYLEELFYDPIRRKNILTEPLLFIIGKANKGNQFNLVRMISSIENLENESKLIPKVSVELLFELKSLFTKFIDEQIHQIETYKSHSKKVQACVLKFPIFADRLEDALSSSDRTFIDNANHKIVIAIFKWLESLGSSDKSATLAMLCENYFHFATSITDRPSLSYLVQYVEESMSLFEDRMKNFIEKNVRKKLRPLSDYFFDIEVLISSGTEVAFQEDFNKQSFQNILNKFNKKPFTHYIILINKTINKHLRSETGLREVARHKAEELVIKFWKRWSYLSKKCYEIDISPSILLVTDSFESQKL